MDSESRLSPAVHDWDQRRARKEPTPALMIPRQASRSDGVGFGPKPAVEQRSSVRSHGYSSSRPNRGTTEDLAQRNIYKQNYHQLKMSNNDSRDRTVGRNSKEAPKKGGGRGTRSAQNSAGLPRSLQTSSALFEVKMNDFPELAGASQNQITHPTTQKECWGPSPASTTLQSPQVSSSRKSGWRASPTLPEPQQSATDVNLDLLVIPAAQQMTSWASIASQPPKKPVPKERPVNGDQQQVEDAETTEQEEGVSRKKKRKKKKKARGSEDDSVRSDELLIQQEPPKFEDEEEFPGLTPALTRSVKLPGSADAKSYNEKEPSQHPSTEQNKMSPSSNTQPNESTKKEKKSEKVSGKKSKVPFQLDIGNMLAVLEKKQQSQKTKQDSKPVTLSVGGGLPAVQKQAAGQKKLPWHQDKIAHNPLDSTSPLVKKGKQREVPKAKKPTPLKRVILKEREERKQRRLLEERGMLPEEELQLPDEATEEKEQCDDIDELSSPLDEKLNEINQIIDETEEEADGLEAAQEPATVPEPEPDKAPKIHSRKFRDYCSQMLSKDVDECVTTLLKELVRFQDRLYQKDPMKARMKRRIVMGLREVLKHLKLRKVKCVIISPNCERIQSKGGLDEALHTIINTCREQNVPFVFALSRKVLGRCVNKAVPVSLVGIFNYDGAQDYYHKMIELSSEARMAYEVMVSSPEQSGPDEETKGDEQQISSKELKSGTDCKTSEEVEYIALWKKLLEKESSHAFLDLKEQLSVLHINSECTENSEEEEQS
ncbi:selenocysteine insertion sequence-binding protein 2-like isoform X2 [Gouania willdenowi]|uniref:selenocysteine insertion sequence-binding protein 2-like isoform X2 n=1 Tax=Gouania willdenowi TaxID=441366 RepID=UPI001054AF6F|nr:selenocysteine insertion sequence-binding protein 2 isoform X2 [Gouania willdenowi]